MHFSKEDVWPIKNGSKLTSLRKSSWSNLLFYIHERSMSKQKMNENCELYQGRSSPFELPIPLPRYKTNMLKRHIIFKPLEDTIPAIVSLKVGAQVMLKANLNLELGLANGSRGVVLELFPGDTPLVKVKWVNGTTSLVEPFTWIQRDKDGFASRSRNALYLGLVSTIHKCQGCSLDCCVGDLSDIWCDHQGYVLASRVRMSDGLLLVNFNPEKITVDQSAVRFMKKDREDCQRRRRKRKGRSIRKKR